MAVGDLAIAAGFQFVPDTGEEGRVRWGAREINRTRDYVAQVKNLIPALPSTAWTTYTPSTGGVVGGTALGRYRYITPKLIELWVQFTSGTVLAAGTPTGMTLPPGLQGDTSLRQPLMGCFNAEIPVMARVEAGGYSVWVSPTNAVGTDWPAGTAMSNVIIKGLVAIQ